MSHRDGANRKRAALDGLESARAESILLGRRALLRRLLETGAATADDVRDAVTLPEGVNPTCLGCVPRPLVAAGIIQHAGFVTTRRPDAHARPISGWALLDEDAALAWLAAHPAPTPKTLFELD